MAVKRPAQHWKKRSAKFSRHTTREIQAKSEAAADMLLHPTAQAAATIQYLYRKELSSVKELPDLLPSLASKLQKNVREINRGDLTRAETMLIAQAHTLDGLFNQLLQRGLRNADEHMNACELYTRLALKAQSQCRATLETLAEIKNPPVLSIPGHAGHLFRLMPAGHSD